MPKAPFAAVVAINLLFAGLDITLTGWCALSLLRGEAIRDAQARSGSAALAAGVFEVESFDNDAKDVKELFAETRSTITRRVAIKRLGGGGRRLKVVDKNEEDGSAEKS